jgi:flagellar FliL protein
MLKVERKKVMIKKHMYLLAIILVLLSYQSLVYAQDVVRKNYSYFSLLLDIVTNYLGSSSRNLGFIRVTIELMLEDTEFL